ncbi:MAG: hypothetical protein ABL894_07070 [Hyphomicrobium sp.]
MGERNQSTPSIWRRAAALVQREFVATMGVSGATLTVLSQLNGVVPMAPWLTSTLVWWHDTMQAFWRPPLEAFHLDVHPHLLAAATLSLFLAVMAGGARIAARAEGLNKPPSRYDFLDGQSLWSVGVFASLLIVFVFGQDKTPNDSPLIICASKEAGKLAFALVGCSGYFLGDMIARDGFHRRLIRLGLILAAILMTNLIALRAWS